MNLSLFEVQQTLGDLEYSSPSVDDGVKASDEAKVYERVARVFFQADVYVTNYLASKGPLGGKVVDDIASTLIQRYGSVRLLDPENIDRLPVAVQTAIRAKQLSES
ncbi:hypothetical protein A2713_00475 [candidate division WWE3 bacterium RIFCSPHIGHO2_01_FULL_35_17]|uniref:Uncharacterized protein n=1 Tax=candidate division WWE3 bacterium RIFCSPHIGHO2_01_FULL_35_17 TaxID=1802614 RepID=A0A1F4UPV4_UNCKA|nr:MAG: hypothetical protein A2713_00475 [candidate division WWE3 bacterium RIFCSPHIGHO2_01_FULL_35_17]